MNQTGTYVHVPGEGLVMISDATPNLAASVWMPRGDIKYYDKSARRWFESKADKREWLQRNGLKEGGIIRNPDKRWDGPTRNASKPTAEQRRQRQLSRQWVQSQGGASGLLSKLQQGGK